MKDLFWRKNICTLALWVASIGLHAQCLIVKQGQKIQLVSKSYANPLPLTEKKWEKMNAEQRDVLIDKLNISIQKGEVKPWLNLTSNFEITEVNNSSPISSFTLKATDGTYVYQTTNYCESDTMHLVRNANLMYSVVKGDTLGIVIQGVARIPNKLKVGDKIPSFNDYMITFPETWNKTVKESVKSFSYTTSENKVGYYQDSKSGAFSHGEFKVTERHDVYSTVNHQLKISENIENLTINYFVAKVTAQEKITVGTNTYDAFVIESESWSKGGLVRNYDSENKTIAREQQAKFDALMDKQAKWSTKTGYTNEQGYKVSYKKEWFVPGYGPVKIEVHDQFGAIQIYMDIIL